MDNQKDILFQRLKKHIIYIQEKLAEEKARVELRIKKDSEIFQLKLSDQFAQFNIQEQRRKRVEELNELHKSLYFARCELKSDKDSESTPYYFAKFHFIEEGISSWISPIATIRFEKPGAVQYTLPSGDVVDTTLVSSEHYTIIDGKVLYFSRETVDSPKQLIYQEKITRQKSGFSLPEIVEKMEGRQDRIIRADFGCSTLISGPAGSGKTTLAFHRVAYLALAPNTAQMFPGSSIIIFIQDAGTKKYFSNLLPELGIKNVLITTFSDWVFDLLKYKNFEFVDRFGKTSEEKDLLEYEKLDALRSGSQIVYKGNPFSMLSGIYKKYLSKERYKIFLEQKKLGLLDRYDLTILLGSYLEKCVAEDNVPKVLYSLMVIDEFQNYLPEQLKVLKRFLSIKTKSMVFIGDFTQQVRIGTIRSFDEINEVIPDEANFVLTKSYRNTGNILRYIKNLGYEMEIPDYVEMGDGVDEFIGSEDEQINYVEKIVQNLGEQIIGVLSDNDLLLERLNRKFNNDHRVHVYSFLKSQGLEFDVVCIVGINKDIFQLKHVSQDRKRLEELQKIKKDGFYIALTRAITKLHILGEEKIKNIIC